MPERINMTNAEKLEKAKKLLGEINDSWSEDEVLEYGSKFSFDELVAELDGITLKEPKKGTSKAV